MKRVSYLFCVVFLILPLSAIAQTKSRQVPPFLIDETFRLTKQCYFFEEWASLNQKKQWYVLAVFLGRDAVRLGVGKSGEVSPQSPCGTKPSQVRLYRLIDDTTVVLCDSILFNCHGVSLGVASDFDKSGLNKVLIQQSCNPPQSGAMPLLCYAISVVEITEKARLRSVLQPGNVPERWVNDKPSGLPLEPVVTDNLDKTPYPELLAIDDFFEGDPAFRPDDFPKITLIYTWDKKARIYRNASEQFSFRFHPPSEISPMPDDTRLVTVMETIMALAAVKRSNDAKRFMDLNMTPDRFTRWRAQAPERGSAITMERLKEKLTRCISRFK